MHTKMLIDPGLLVVTPCAAGHTFTHSTTLICKVNTNLCFFSIVKSDLPLKSGEHSINVSYFKISVRFDYYTTL